VKRLLVISRDKELVHSIESSLNGTYAKTYLANAKDAVDAVLNEIPDLIIIDTESNGLLMPNLLSNLKNDPMFRQLPILAIVADTSLTPEWGALLIDDYIFRSNIEREFATRVGLCIKRLERITEINPLTRLPGNISINKQIQRCLDNGEIFALAYADLDHFKVFNDTYGFSRGDDLIRMTGRVILNIVSQHQGNGAFVGHIGGDDFVFIVDAERVRETAEEIVRTFDQIVPLFYNEADRINGNIECTDRYGNRRVFPMVGLSIGIVSNEHRTFSHYGEVSQVASELKKHAKGVKGSCLRFDRRRG
jgi:diguanylate cyclase (GGDEF)-like protein